MQILTCMYTKYYNKKTFHTVIYQKLCELKFYKQTLCCGTVRWGVAYLK